MAKSKNDEVLQIDEQGLQRNNEGTINVVEKGESSAGGHVTGQPYLLYYFPKVKDGSPDPIDTENRYRNASLGFRVDSDATWGAPLHASPFAIAVNSAKMIGELTSNGNGDTILDGTAAVSVGIGNIENDKLYWAFPEGKTSDSTSLRLGKRGVLNPLYQYNEHADVRVEEPFGSNYGEVYQEKIRKNDHIVFIQPGRPRWSSPAIFFAGQLKGTDNEDALRSAIASASLGDLQQGVTIDDLMADLKLKSFNKYNPARFYDFIPDFNNYRAYVRGLLNELMIRMGLSDEAYQSKFYIPFTNIQIGTTNVDAFTQFLQYWGFLDNVNAQNRRVGFKAKAGYLPFRVENTSSANDSWSNTIGASDIAGRTKAVSTKARETLYLTGGSQVDSNDNYWGSGVMNFLKDLAGGTMGLASDPGEAIIRTGGNMLIPDVWQDSTVSKTISLKFKLHAVYGNPQSYYENVLFPLICLIALMAPRQLASAIYTGPPLLRIASKGWVYGDLCMAESLVISRGDTKNDWSVYGLPRTVECDLTVRDLLGSMILSLGGVGKDTISVFHKRNTALREYLNVLAGIDTFADSWWSSHVEQKYRLICTKFGQAFDPRNWAMGMTRVPVVRHGVKLAARWFGK